MVGLRRAICGIELQTWKDEILTEKKTFCVGAGWIKFRIIRKIDAGGYSCRVAAIVKILERNRPEKTSVLAAHKSACQQALVFW